MAMDEAVTAVRDGAAMDGPSSGGPQLRRGTVGVAGMVILVVAATAPLTALASNFALSFALGVGAGTVLVLVGVGGLLAFFAAGYIVLSRHVTNAGAYYAFIGFGLGKSAGAGAAMVATLAYNLAAGGFSVLTGYFAAITIEQETGTAVPWWLLAAASLVMVTLLGVRGIGVTQVVTAVICAAQFVVVIAFAVAVALRRPEGWAPSSLAPESVFEGASR